MRNMEQLTEKKTLAVLTLDVMMVDGLEKDWSWVWQIEGLMLCWKMSGAGLLRCLRNLE